jgi:hypothetical protein
MDKQILSEFQKFLLDKKFIPEKNTPFYAYWVNKFLNVTRDGSLTNFYFVFYF